MPHLSGGESRTVTPVSDSGRRPVGRSRRNFSRSTPAMTPPASGPAVPSFPDGPAEGVFYGLPARDCLPADLMYNCACTLTTLCSDVRAAPARTGGSTSRTNQTLVRWPAQRRPTLIGDINARHRKEAERNPIVSCRSYRYTAGNAGRPGCGNSRRGDQPDRFPDAIYCGRGI